MNVNTPDYPSFLIFALKQPCRFTLEDNRKVIYLLIDKGADVNTKDDQGQTPLMIAVIHKT